MPNNHFDRVQNVYQALQDTTNPYRKYHTSEVKLKGELKSARSR